jgi:hypothetical protein
LLSKHRLYDGNKFREESKVQIRVIEFSCPLLFLTIRYKKHLLLMDSERILATLHRGRLAVGCVAAFNARHADLIGSEP